MRPPYSNRTQAYARRRAEANMLDTIRIARPTKDPSVSDDDLVVRIGEHTTIYEGKAQVGMVRGSGVIMIGDIDLDARITRIGYPWDAPVARQDDIVVILKLGSDVQLEHQVFQVREVSAGGLLHDRRLVDCTGIAPSRRWSP